jgi:type I restriction enzyme S subunit
MTYVVSSEEVKNNRCDAYYFQPKFEDVEKAVNEGKFEVKEIEKEIILSNKLENIENYSFINYVDLASINKNLGLIKNYNKLDIAEAPSRARQKIENEDLLLSSLVGSLKSIAIFEDNIENPICSTGFYVIKKSKNYNNYYLWALFRSYIFQTLLQRESSGAIMSAINREALLSLKIPLPPLSVQNKIADEVKKRMQKAEQLQKEAKEELEKAKLEVEKIIVG